MTNDLRIGLCCGVACVFAVAILFFQRQPTSGSTPTAKINIVKSEPRTPATASIPGGPLPRPTKTVARSLSNPIP